MEPEVRKIKKELQDRLDEALAETKTLYEINHIEEVILLHVVAQVYMMGYTNKLMARILRAASHFVEESGKALVESTRKLNNDKP